MAKVRSKVTGKVIECGDADVAILVNSGKFEKVKETSK